jgi:signal transduction histidine kinase
MLDLVSMCAASRLRLSSTGRALHDDVGPLLAAAGMLLSSGEQAQALAALDQAMERVRELSQQLNPSPVDRMGLKNALERLVEQAPEIELDFKTKAKPSREEGSLLYEMTLYALRAAAEAGADLFRIEVTGDKNVIVRVIDDGNAKQRPKALAVPIALAEAMGLRVTIATRKSTIVSIAHAHRRSSR